MRSTKRITLICLALFSLFAKAQMNEVPFTLDDRDRIIRTEQKVEALDDKIDSKVDGLRSEMNARFDQLFSFLWVLVSIFSAMLATVFGFAFWDRKISVTPMKRENAKIIESLREFSEHNPRLREILKNAGLL